MDVDEASTRTATAQPLVVPAPAKLNLFLHVTGRRADGYHTLESLFVLIDFADMLEISDRADGQVIRDGTVHGVAERDDLALRAAHALRDATGTARGATIRVHKRIPLGAGLGGGSSDAATVLLALNRLWSLRLPRDELMRIGAALGADVPFFVGGDAAVARGVGERLTPVSLPPQWIVLALPDAHVATAAIFAAPELTRSSPSAKIDVFSEGYGSNDLQRVAATRHPPVREALEALQRTSRAARMTGSGACVFAPFAAQSDAQAALASLPPHLPRRIARTVARHPLASFA
jgi:4-diphosphocytidyl-2-C-methyl-D-erythritol kinase